MKTFAAIELGGAAILRVERKVDAHSASHARLRITYDLARGKRAAAPGPELWIPPGVLPEVIKALQAVAESYGLGAASEEAK